MAAPRRSIARSARGLASPPTAISPRLANEPYEHAPRSSDRSARVSASGPTVASAIHPVTPAQGRPAAAPETPLVESPPRTDAVRAVPTAPSARRLAALTSDPGPRSDRTLPVLAVLILAAGAAAIWFLRPALTGGHDAPPPTPAPSGTAGGRGVPAAPAFRCRAALVVRDAPTNAEVLVRVGQAPVDVEHMPVGARLEFVATAEGYAPKRVVVPGGATWDTGSDGKPRYEVAVQLDHTRARAGGVDPWPAGEPGSEVGGKGAPGTVHLVATPRGAEVWLLAGLGPEARIDQLPCGGEIEVLVAGPTTLRKRIRVAESDFVSVDGGADPRGDRQRQVALRR